MNNNETIIPAGTYYSDKFEYVNHKLRQHFQLANNEIDQVKQHVNELVVIVHNDRKDWSIKKICDYIAGRNDDFEELGFSTRTIFRYLNEENRKLIDTTKQKGKNSHNNVLVDDDDTCHHTVLEDSSSRPLPTAYEIKDAETAEEIGFDDDSSSGTEQEVSRIRNFNDRTFEEDKEEFVTTAEPNEYIKQYDELEVTKQMLHHQIEKNSHLINDIRELKGVGPLKVSPPEQEEELEDEKMKLEYLNDTQILVDESELLLYDEGRIEEFISHWDQLKRLFREMVEIALYKADKNDEKMSIQNAIYDVLYYLEGHRGLSKGSKLKFPDGLARYISEYFIDQKAEMYFRIKFQTSRINDDTLGFNEWRKELAKTSKQRKEDKKLFLEELRKSQVEMVERINQQGEEEEGEEEVGGEEENDSEEAVGRQDLDEQSN